MRRILFALAWIAGLASLATLAIASDSTAPHAVTPERLQPELHWQVLRPETATFEIGFPGAPEFSQQVHSTWVGSIVEQRWAIERHDLHLEVLRYELPFISTFVLSDSSLLRRARDSLLEDRGGRQLSWERAAVSDHPGWTLHFQVPDPGAGTEEARFLLAGRTLYILDAAAGSGGPESPRRHFFDSFRLH